MSKKQFAIWEVNGIEYKLKLKTATVSQLEEKLGRSLMAVFNTDGMPPLSIMLTIAHGAMKDWNSNIKRSDVDDLFDQYLDEGGSQLEFFTKTFMDIYKVSGFFTAKQIQEMENNLEKVQEAL